MAGLDAKLALSLGVGIEYLLTLAAVAALLRAAGSRSAPALAYAVPTVLGGFSALYTLSFLLAGGRGLWLADLAAVAVIVWSWRTARGGWAALGGDALALGRRLPVAAGLIATALVLLGLAGFLSLPMMPDAQTYHLARIALALDQGSLFPANHNNPTQVAYGFGYDLLAAAHLRFGSDFGVTLPSLICLIGLAAATSALVAALGGGAAAALTAVSAILATPLALAHGLLPKTDLAVAMAALIMAAAAAGFHRDRRRIDLLAFVLAGAFGTAAKASFVYFAVPATLLIAAVHGRELAAPALVTWRTGRLAAIEIGQIAVAAATVLGLALQIRHNLTAFGGPFGDPASWMLRSIGIDGLYGGMLNAARALVQIAGLPIGLVGNAPIALHDQLLGPDRAIGVAVWNLAGINPVFLGSSWPFVGGQSEGAMYEPLGVLALIGLAAGLGARAPLRRALALTALAWWLLTAAAGLSWMPWNLRFYAPTVFLGFALLAAALDRRPMILTIWRAIALACLVWHLALFLPDRWRDLKTDLTDRGARYAGLYAPGFWPAYTRQIPPGARILLVVGDGFAPMPLLTYRPDLRLFVAGIKPGGPGRVVIDGQPFDIGTVEGLAAAMAAVDVPGIDAALPADVQNLYAAALARRGAVNGR